MENLNEPENQDVREMRKGTWAVPDRLPTLSRGCHPPGSAHPCAMEAASWLAGEEWSDAPKCVHPAIASVARWVNDNIGDDQLQKLWPFILASVGTSTRHRPLVAWRLRATAAKAKETFRMDPLRAWYQILDRHKRLTGSGSTVTGIPPGAETYGTL